MAKTDFPLTIYGLLARRHDVKDANYVEKIVNGRRKAIRGKAAAILEDWNKLKDSFDDWITEFKADGAMIVNMDDIHVSVYVHRGIASIYKCDELKNEADVNTMNMREFKDFLNGIRINYN